MRALLSVEVACLRVWLYNLAAYAPYVELPYADFPIVRDAEFPEFIIA